jgi:CheY-like chemotaxis protein
MTTPGMTTSPFIKNGRMNEEHERRQVILILNDIEETGHLTKKMLGKNDRHVALASDEEDAISKARSESPDLLLMSLDLKFEELLATAQRIRQKASFGEDVAIVIFCVPTIPEGAEMEVKKNVYVTHPDNFDQLRDLLHRLLLHPSSTY